jgi:hypothetical protein
VSENYEALNNSLLLCDKLDNVVIINKKYITLRSEKLQLEDGTVSTTPFTYSETPHSALELERMGTKALLLISAILFILPIVAFAQNELQSNQDVLANISNKKKEAEPDEEERLNFDFGLLFLVGVELCCFMINYILKQV